MQCIVAPESITQLLDDLILATQVGYNMESGYFVLASVVADFLLVFRDLAFELGLCLACSDSDSSSDSEEYDKYLVLIV